jgi:DNA-binding CsgD family transcriptional regulator
MKKPPHELLVIQTKIALKNLGYNYSKIADAIGINVNTLCGYFVRKDMPLSVYCALRGLVENNKSNHQTLVSELHVKLKAAGINQNQTAEAFYGSKNTVRAYYKKKDMPLRVYCILNEKIKEKLC